MKAYRITQDGHVSQFELSEDGGRRLVQMQQAVGGFIEALGLTETLVMWMDEEGKYPEKGNRANRIACRLVDAYGVELTLADQIMGIVGDVLLTGFDEATGEIAPLPPYAAEVVATFAPGALV